MKTATPHRRSRSGAPKAPSAAATATPIATSTDTATATPTATAADASTKARANTSTATATPGPGPGQGPVRAGAAAKRQAILDAALEEFSARGFDATRMEDVAARAGVAKGTIYLHFADKEALFQELVRAMLDPVVEGLE